MSNYETFFIHDDLFDRIDTTNHDKYIMKKFISNEPNENEYLINSTEMCDEKIKNKKRAINKTSPKHNLQRKRKKLLGDYRGKAFDDFRLFNVYPPPKLDSEESNILLVILVYQVKIYQIKLYPK